VAEAARARLLVDQAAVVLVGDIDAFGEALEAAGLGTMVIERDPVADAQPVAEAQEPPGPVDKEDLEGPTAGAEEPDLPGTPDEPREAG
jgi:hypothetical protein